MTAAGHCNGPTARRHVEVLRWLAVHGLDLGAINDHGQGCISKAAWFGHEGAVHWLICAEDGPRLGHHLGLTEHENGLTVEHLTHCAGHFALACWLGVLTAIVQQQPHHEQPTDTSAQKSGVSECCVGMKLPEALSKNPSQAMIEWLPWREEQLVRPTCFTVHSQRSHPNDFTPIHLWSWSGAARVRG